MAQHPWAAGSVTMGTRPRSGYDTISMLSKWGRRRSGDGNTRDLVYVAVASANNARKENASVATDYDEVRSDVKESQDRSLEALKSANAQDARSVVRELDESDALDDAITPGGEFVAEELIVEVIPQAEDEFTCYSCFLVRHRSQLAREKNGHSYCVECEG